MTVSESRKGFNGRERSIGDINHEVPTTVVLGGTPQEQSILVYPAKVRELWMTHKFPGVT